MGVFDGVRQVAGRAVAVVRSRLPQPVKRGKLELVGPVRGSGGPISPRHGVQTRASAVGRLIAMMTGGRNVPQRSTVHYEVNARDGYERNPIVYRCIRLVAEAVKTMPPIAFAGETELDPTHPLRVLLDSPNPRQSWGDLVDEMVGHLYLAGEDFLEGVMLPRTGLVDEIYSLRPDRVAILQTEKGDVAAYDYEASSGVHRFQVPERGWSPILHVRQWNPRDHLRGFPVVGSAAAPADEYSDSVAQNRSLLNNSVMPSGALVYEPKEGQGNLSDEAFDRLKAELNEEHAGPSNHGRPIILDNMKWYPMGMSPRDAMAVEQRNQAARETALALGVPPLVLGLPGDNTYANYAEANAAFYRQTVLPLAIFIGDKFTRWLRPVFGKTIRIELDVEQSPMAEAERTLRWERSEKATDLTVDERRALKGYEELPDGKGKHVLVPAGLSTLDDVILGEPDPAEAGAEAYGPDKRGDNNDE
jgi:HK97 family phage portal protein